VVGSIAQELVGCPADELLQFDVGSRGWLGDASCCGTWQRFLPALVLGTDGWSRLGVRVEGVQLTISGPLVGVSAVVVREGAVLLGRRRGAHGSGTWAFRGGGDVTPGLDE
jgi:hypothetical protein